MTTADEARTVLELELCGKLADVGGAFVKTVIPAEGCSVAELFAMVARQHPALAPSLGGGRIRACVNEAVVAPNARVMPGDEVALFPPVSGG